MAAKSAPTSREVWLDGLRGVAAVIVVWFHMTAGKLATPYRSFWDTPASENRHFFQIAPFRIFFSGPGMVDIFFVVSGYSISIGLIKLRHGSSLSGFYQRLTSSVVRRMVRLCFPVAVTMLGSHALYYAGLYTMEFKEGTGCPGAGPWKSPVPHIQCLIRSFISIVNMQNIQNLTLNDRKLI
jgi:peptidoglycan/LPS O-acetylase OafA/YrhL